MHAPPVTGTLGRNSRRDLHTPASDGMKCAQDIVGREGRMSPDFMEDAGGEQTRRLQRGEVPLLWNKYSALVVNIMSHSYISDSNKTLKS